ncbi:hypothetical protein LTR35_016407 [Friedmanniomyces endolithicus]|nr:hypothetical protein LTR35_016407 [Friedmanniomyces endolithicus]KAK0978537.1 hypothetical protein LTR54_015914 [Friedmanniomyces endolithicus]
MNADSSAAQAAAKKKHPSGSSKIYHQHSTIIKAFAEAADSLAVDEMSDDSVAERSLESAQSLPQTEHKTPSIAIPRHHKDLRQDSFFSTTSARSMVPLGIGETVIEESRLEPPSPRFVKARPTSHLPWSPPQDTPNLPPVANFALAPRVPSQRPAKKSKGASWICSVCRVQARSIDLERTIQCCNRNCGLWFHLRCVDLKDLPQGRYGWSCKECDADDANNGLFSINDNLEWQGDDDERHGGWP